MVSVAHKVVLAYLSRKGVWKEGLHQPQKPFLQMNGPASDAIVVRIAGIFSPTDLKKKKKDSKVKKIKV